MQHYSRLCGWLAALLLALNLAGLVTIVGCLALQVFTRYVLNIPMQLTDEIALNTLTMMCFLGGAFLYRERGHIEIDYFADKLPPRLGDAVAIVIEIAVIVVMIMIMSHVIETREKMIKVMYGTMLFSKYHLQFLPLFFSAVCTSLFALEHIFNTLRGERQESSSVAI